MCQRAVAQTFDVTYVCATGLRGLLAIFSFIVFLLLDNGKHFFNSLVHQPFEKFGEVPCETSVKKCVTVDVSHIIFWH